MKKIKQTEEKVFSYIEEKHMLKPGDRVITGVSGGADSVCLLFLLLEWAKKKELSIAVVHVNHGIRAEAGKDADYVEKLCKEYSLSFYLVEEDVQSLARREKCSEEEAGRKVRYQAFEKAAQEFSANKIAVAHNSNDRSETMLFHLFRGSGLKGLGSIQPMRGNIIRPILCLERKEIESYLAARQISCCKDITNDKDDYTRNRIRHHIIPYAEKEIVSGCISHMARTADLLSEIEEYLGEQTQRAIEFCVETEENLQESRHTKIAEQTFAKTDKYNKNKKIIISIEKFLLQHTMIQKRVLFYLVKELSPHQKDISYIHIRDLQNLFTKEGNHSIYLPFGIVGRKEYKLVILEQDKEEKIYKEDKSLEQYVTIKIPNRKDFIIPIMVSDRKISVEFQAFSYEKEKEVIQNEYTKWFDCDKIKKSLVLRTRQTGDYLTISDGKGNIIHKSVKDYMITQKIPKHIRDNILLLAEGNHVLWLIGYRISEYYKISENTECILQVTMQQDCKSSRTEEKNGGAY